MHSPYGLELNGSCENCSQRGDQFFCNLPKPELKAFESIKYTSGYPKGAVLFVEEEAPRGVFVVCKGRVKLTMTSIDGKTMILRIVGPGEVLGLHAVVSGEAYQSTAETMEPCQFDFVRREDFLRFLRDHAEASIHAAQQLSGNYQAACAQIRSLGLTHSASGKLAKFLLESSAAGQVTKQGTRMRLTMTHEEIGQMIGASRETVTRTLGQFKQRQVVAQNGSMMLIQNRAALETYAGA
ncbi:MAG TPA: Crp/Fnr family transcriptional regulator [Terriglobia bacterium]|nr:Crp/Fnr family transcriptional regulator [Terriglobia bacterium]